MSLSLLCLWIVVTDLVHVPGMSDRIIYMRLLNSHKCSSSNATINAPLFLRSVVL